MADRFVADVVTIDGYPYSVVYDRQTGHVAVAPEDVAESMAANLNANPQTITAYRWWENVDDDPGLRGN